MDYGIMSHSDHSVQRCFKSNTPVVYRPNIWQFGKHAGGGLSPFRHSELWEPRGERRRMLKRKLIFIQVESKLHIQVNTFIAQPYSQM